MSTLNSLVTYESMYGNTRAVGEAIAEGLGDLGDVTVLPLHQAGPEAAANAGLIVVGGPTHMHGLSTSASRKAAVQAAEEDGHEVEPGAIEGPGLRRWLSNQAGDGRRAAAFDTRIDKSPLLTGSAARGIAKRLRRAGFEVISPPESFFVEDSEGPLADGELERARTFGMNLAEKCRPMP